MGYIISQTEAFDSPHRRYSVKPTKKWAFTISVQKVEFSVRKVKAKML